MRERWNIEQAWSWYNRLPWIRGCNFMGSDCANRIDQWQAYGFEERLKTADRELALAAETGFNAIRIIPEFFVWQQDRAGFMERFERYVSVAAKHGIACMVVFGNDCMQPKEWTRPMTLGEQPCDWGYHGGRKQSQHGKLSSVGYHLLDEPELALQHYEWVREIITAYRNDDRILVWDMFNEIGNSHRGALSEPHLRKFFEIGREIDPIQPLTACTWSASADISVPLAPMEQLACDLSDVISYHNYGSYEHNVLLIHRLREQFGRPLLNTEWLARCLHNNVQELFPLFYLEQIACFNWGFVAGKYQTYEPWNNVWEQYADNPSLDFDFTKWFHDLYRPSLHPYDPKEIELIQRFCKRADADFARKR